MISDSPVLLDACVLVQAAVRPFGIKAKHPDEFLIDLYHLDGEMVIHELHQQGTSLRTPRTISEVLVSLETCKCVQFAQLIRDKLALSKNSRSSIAFELEASCTPKRILRKWPAGIAGNPL